MHMAVVGKKYIIASYMAQNFEGGNVNLTVACMQLSAALCSYATLIHAPDHYFPNLSKTSSYHQNSIYRYVAMVDVINTKYL